ncbi:alpha/beta hydrolase [Asanoa ishikariensis]|uniref:Pimeloyl-ACP methyl ester carboxylesterase n=1 Tax=Asanoa ishikariensis TaxID=137265 RepID=A0A1H3T3N8_9ACTN|nr:alpha/beta hydrolase [Asanoa ishikariensis]SDZ44650.1 Pimeloyl-ACP methyl ester carboxylesterase [Asanoa ishikariensis]
MVRVTDTDWSTDLAGTGGYADVNGINLYYERYGAGRPLVLLHGGLGSGEMFGPVLPLLAATHEVITVDLQGHGRTADVDRPLSLDAMAADVAALIDHLGLGQADLAGYSLGGGVAMHVAANHPAKVGKLVMASAWLRTDSIYPEMRAMQGQVSAAAAEFMVDTPMYQLYQKVAPRPEDFGRLLDKIGDFMRQGIDFTEKVSSLTVPTMVVGADADQVPPTAFMEIFGLLDGGKRDGGWTGEGRPAGGHALAILPGVTHYSIFSSPLFAAVILDFLDR